MCHLHTFRLKNEPNHYELVSIVIDIMAFAVSILNKAMTTKKWEDGEECGRGRVGTGWEWLRYERRYMDSSAQSTLPH